MIFCFMYNKAMESNSVMQEEFDNFLQLWLEDIG